MTNHWERDLREISDRARELVAEMEQAYVGPNADRRSITEIGEWRDIVNMAAERCGELAGENAHLLSERSRQRRDRIAEQFSAEVDTWTAAKLRGAYAQPEAVARAEENDRLREQVRMLREAVAGYIRERDATVEHVRKRPRLADGSVELGRVHQESTM